MSPHQGHHQQPPQLLLPIVPGLLLSPHHHHGLVTTPPVPFSPLWLSSCAYPLVTTVAIPWSPPYCPLVTTMDILLLPPQLPSCYHHGCPLITSTIVLVSTVAVPWLPSQLCQHHGCPSCYHGHPPVITWLSPCGHPLVTTTAGPHHHTHPIKHRGRACGVTFNVLHGTHRSRESPQCPAGLAGPVPRSHTWHGANTAPCRAFVPHTTARPGEQLPAWHGACKAPPGWNSSLQRPHGAWCRAHFPPPHMARRCLGRDCAGPGAADVGAGQNRRALSGRGLAYLIDSSRPAQPHSARGLRGVVFSPRPGGARPIE